MIPSLIFAQSNSKKVREFYKRHAETAHPLPILNPNNQNKEKVNKYFNWLLQDDGIKESQFVNINAIIEEEEGAPMQNESSIAINYKNKKNLIASAVDYRNNSTTKVYISSDGGLTWGNKDLGRPHDYWRSTNDPSVVFGADGVGYLVYGGFANVLEIPDSLRGQNGVFLSKTTDEGKTWLSHIPIIEHLGVQTIDSTLEDKYYIEIDEAESSPFYNYLYCPWKRVTAIDSATQIVIARSTDGGIIWESPIPVSDRRVGSDLDTTYGLSFPLSATGPNGEVYLVWNDGPVHGIGFSSSIDGGISWSSPKILKTYDIFGITKYLEGQGAYRHSVKGLVRAETYPVIKCNNAIGTKGEGNLYLSWAADNIPNIYFSMSSDKGETWSESKIIHSDPKNDQFFHWMDIDRTNGDIAIMYLDSRNDPENIDVECFVAYSNDMGKTWVDRRVSDFAFDIRNNPFPGRSFAGDYSGCSFYDGKIYPSWIDMRNAPQPTASDSDIFTAIINVNAPSPVSNFKVELDPNRPKSLDLSWDLELLSSFGKILDSNILYISLNDNFGNSQSFTSDKREVTLTNLKAYERYEYEIVVIYEADSSKIVKGFNYPGGAKEPDIAELISFDGLTSNMVELSLKLPSLRADKTTELVNMSALELYRDGEFIKTIQVNAIDTGNVLFIEDSPAVNGFYKYNVRVVSSIGEGEENKQYSRFSNELLSYSGKAIYWHQETFEEELPKYYITENWELDNGFVLSGNYSITNALNKKYVANQSDTLIIYPISKQNGENTFLSFYQSAIIKRGDKAMIEYSIDNMNTWENVGTFDSRDFEPWGDKEINELDWRFEKIDLSNNLGTNIFIRFIFSSNAGLHDEGWNIDDIYLASLPLSVRDDISHSINIYPNPAKDFIFISSDIEDRSFSNFRIYNLFGQEIYKAEIPIEGRVRVDLTGYEKGTYIININGIIKKFVKY